MYLAVAEKQGVAFDKLNGTLQNDILKEYIAQKEWIYPPKPSIRIITDLIGFCIRSVPKWNTISISGYHIREAGSTAVQELAFTIADGIGYVQAGIEAGLKKSPKCGPVAGCGPGSCGTVSAPPTPNPGCAGSTPRPPGTA
jgi:methylmalonyl-CoA mutase N-terminal domain/subunit